MQTLDLKQSYFELFGLDLKFDIDLRQLNSSQQSLQAIYHPDRFVTASDQEKRLSVQQAAWINQGFETLSNPVNRARYMLELNGLKINDETETTSDTEFLMEQLAIREEIDECRQADDPLSCCDAIAGKLQAKADYYASEFVAAYGQDELDQARMTSRKMQFIQRILDQLNEFQIELEDA